MKEREKFKREKDEEVNGQRGKRLAMQWTMGLTVLKYLRRS